MDKLKENGTLMPRTLAAIFSCLALFVRPTAWQPDRTHDFIIHVSVALDGEV